MLLMLLFYVVVLFIPLWYLYRRSQAANVTQFELRGVKYAPMPNALVTFLQGRNFTQTLEDHIQKSGKVFGTRFLFGNTIVIADADLAQIVLVREFTNFVNRRKIAQPDPILENFLTVVEDEQWKRIRSVVSPTFSSGKLRLMKPFLNRALCRLVDRIEKNFDASTPASAVEIDMKELLSTYTMDTIIQTAFGIEIDFFTQPNHPIIVNASKVTAGALSLRSILAFLLLVALPKSLSCIANWITDKQVTNFFSELSSDIIAKKRAQMRLAQQGNVESRQRAKNFIELLIESETEVSGMENQKKYVTNPEMVAQSLIFFIAGYDTTSSSMALAAYFLAINPDVQERLYEEVNTVLQEMKTENLDEGDDDDDDPLAFINYDHLNRFPYLCGVIDETLRFYPPASVVERSASRDLDLVSPDGETTIHVKKGDILQVPIYNLHHNPEYFREPHLFRPERFDAPEWMTHPRHAYLPFGAGPRNCVARSFALFQARLTLLYLVYRYKLSTSPRTKSPPEFNPQTFITKNVWLHVEPRG